MRVVEISEQSHLLKKVLFGAGRDGTVAVWVLTGQDGGGMGIGGTGRWRDGHWRDRTVAGWNFSCFADLWFECIGL